MKDPYVPIDCEFHDRLEDAAVRKKQVRIEFWSGEIQESINAVIQDIRIEDGAEFLILDSNKGSIRLDNIVSLDGNILQPILEK
jgi:Rho-binding antiterminator